MRNLILILLVYSSPCACLLVCPSPWSSRISSEFLPQASPGSDRQGFALESLPGALWVPLLNTPKCIFRVILVVKLPPSASQQEPAK